MKIEKLNDEQLVKQIIFDRIGCIVVFILGFIFLGIHFFISENIRYLTTTILLMASALYFKHQEMYDKIRLEIRENNKSK